MDKAKKLIDDAIANAKEKSGHNPNACTLKVPHELIGMLIGRGGETIKDSVCFRVLDRWNPCVILYLSSCFGFSIMLRSARQISHSFPSCLDLDHLDVLFLRQISQQTNE